MTFDTPLWLLLLLAAPVLWWLHRHLRAPREIVVSSVEPLQGARLDASGRRPERTLDVDLALLLVAVVSLSLAAAGLRVGTRAPAVLVAVDTSASMAVPAASGGTLGESAWNAAMLAVSAVDPIEDVVVVDLAAPDVATRASVADAACPAADPMAVDELPRALAPVLAQARRDGFPGVLLVTDRGIEPGPGVVVSGPTAAAPPLSAILDLVLADATTARVTVLRGDANDRALVTYRAPGGTITTRLPVGEGPVVVTVPAPTPGNGATYHLQPQSVGPNTSLSVRRVGGVRRVRVVAGDAPRLRALLRTLGIEIVDEALQEVDVVIVVGAPATAPDVGTVPTLHLAVPVGEHGDLVVRAAEPTVAADRVSCSGALADAVPSPGIALVRSGVLAAGSGEHASTWTTEEGVVATALPRRVVTTLDPESASSTWHTDPSFPVFVMASLEHIVGGPDRLEIHGAVPRSEIVREAPPPPPASVAQIAALVREPRADPDSRSLAGALAVVAAAMVAVLLVRGRGRFSNV